MTLHRSFRSSAFAIGAGALVALGAIAATHALLGRLAPSGLDTAGGDVFSRQCAGCHAVVPDAATGFGPNLHGIANVASERRPDMLGAEYLLDSIVNPENHREPGVQGHMPSGLLASVPPPDVRSLLRWLAAQGLDDPGALDDEIAALDIVPAMLRPTPRPSGDLAMLRRGERLFFHELGCVACHSAHDDPGSGLLAPSLGQAATLAPDYIVQSLREPSAVIAPGYRRAVVERTGAPAVEGLLVHESDDSFTLLTTLANGQPQRRRFDRNGDTRLILRAESTMPAYELSADDERALVAFLGMLAGATGGT